jgi:hypothetical protein
MLARTALLQAMLFESDFKHAESFLISLGIESVGIYKKLATGACCPECPASVGNGESVRPLR